MATYTESYEIEFPKQSGAEEIANTLTHGIGMLLSVVGWAVLVALAVYHEATWGQLAATLVYGASLTAVYAASTFSHAIQEPRRKQFFRILDQAVIYCLIAGTYTPFILTYLSAERKWAVLVAVWLCAIWGFVSKAFMKHRIEAVVVANYILLGWLPAMAMLRLIPLDCVFWMACGGILYTVGALFLMLDQRVPFFHATWHAFVLAASACHFFAVVTYTIL
ncbi:MAG: PAQR family membrane homeostasis protein TrhA [Pirellulaceae bacterium]